MRSEIVEFAYRQHTRGKSVDDILSAISRKFPEDVPCTPTELITALSGHAATLNQARDEHALALSLMTTRDRLQFLYGEAVDRYEDLMAADDPKLVGSGVAMMKEAHALAESAHRVEVENYKLATGASDEHDALKQLDEVLSFLRPELS